MRWVRHSLRNARRIMYGNILQIYPDAALEKDRLRGGAYKAKWSAEGDMKTVRTFCPNIFLDKAPVRIQESWKKYE